MIRVLIAEDSLTCRALLVQIIESDPELRVVATVGDGAQAVAMTKQLRPDVVIMDVHMPGMDGFEATRQIMVAAPTPIVIVSATVDVHETAVSMHALRMGALTLLRKPALIGVADFTEMARQFTSTVRAMSAVRVVRRFSERPPPLIAVPVMDMTPARIVAIAASTGGPAALYRILSELPRNFALPILIVQHIAPDFVHALATWLDSASALDVGIAEHGQHMQPGKVYLAPDDHHVGIAAHGPIEISAADPIRGFRPSATYLFDSVARAHGAASIGVILTGMGEDGVAGLRAMRKAGGHIIAQDQESSIVFGMPAAAISAGVVDAVLPLDLIAANLTRMTQNATASEGSNR